MKSTKRLVYMSLLIAQAMVLSYIESLIPLHFGIQGAKLGLANIVTLVSLYTLNLRSTLLIICARTLLTAAMFGNFNSYIYSLAGALVSFCFMAFLLRYQNRVSLPFISIVGAITHNLGQLTIAAIYIENHRIILVYWPFLVLIAVPTGLLIGVCSQYLLSYLSKTGFKFKV